MKVQTINTKDGYKGWIEVVYFETNLKQKRSSTASSVGGASSERKANKLLIVSNKNSIINISRQTAKWNFFIGLCLGSGLLFLFGMISVFSDNKISRLLIAFLGPNAWLVVTLVAVVTVFISMICLSLMIKCPQCNLRWFWYGLAKDPKRNIMIGYMRHCPRCNYPEKEKVDIKTVFISKKPILEVSHQKRKYHFLWSVLIIAMAIMFLGLIGLVNNYKFFEFWRFCLFGGFIAAFIILVGLWVSIRCPQCGLKWYWYAFSKDRQYLRIGNVTHCPRCNCPE